jgi:replicative DNA helicase
MSNEAEQCFIGIILDNSKLLDDYDLIANDFMGLDNRQLFQAILDMKEHGDFIDNATFLDYVSKTYPENNRLFGHTALIMSGFVSDAGMANYYKAIRRDSQGAKLVTTLTGLASMAGEHGSYPDKMENVLNTLAELQEPEQKGIVDLKTNLKGFIDELGRRQSVQGMDGIATGFNQLDERLNGLKPGNLIIIAGRPAMGKTTFALNICDHNAMVGKMVLLFSREMTSSELIDKSVANLSGVALNSIKSGNLSETEWPLISQTVSNFQDKSLFIDECSRTVQQMSIIAKKKKMREGLDLIVIDYLQLMDGKGDNRTAQIGSITRGLKALAKELEIPIILLSQLSREVEKRPDKRPMMSDLRDSGEIEQDADIIMFVYRDEVYYEDDAMNKGFAEILVRKFRNGEIGNEILCTDLSKSKFMDVSNFTYQPYENKKQSRGGFNG